MAWDSIRRAVEYRLNLEAAHAKARLKNFVLPALQDKFEKALNQGIVLELEAGMGAELDELVEAAVGEAPII